MGHWSRMAIDFFSPEFDKAEFDKALMEVGLQARREAFAEGHSVIYRDDCGCHVREHPDGRKFEIRFRPGVPRDQHVEVIRDLPAQADRCPH